MSENFTRFVEKKNQIRIFESGQICCHFGTRARPSPSMKIGIVPPVSFSTELR